MAVFVSHLSWKQISGGFLWQLQFIGHDAVIVFFVLSGFVIQYAAAAKEKTLLDYQVARFARLYSVVIPALLLTYLFDHIGIKHDPSIYDLGRETNPGLRLAAGALFISQSWSWNLELLSNDPFWSLPYEFWYYQMFAAATFFRGAARIVLVAIAFLIAGPAILIYLPLWLAGAVTYRMSRQTSLEPTKAAGIFVISVIGLFAVLIMDYKGAIIRTNAPYWPRGFSFVDYLVGALIAVNIYSACFIRLPITALAKPISTAAGVTFALYLLHLPILHLASAFTPSDLPVPLRGLILGTVTLLAVIALSFVTEQRKKQWRRLFRWLFSRFRKPATA